MNEEELRRGRLLILGAAVCWSLGGGAVKIAQEQLDAYQIAGFRSLFSFVFLCVVMKTWRARPIIPPLSVWVMSSFYVVTVTLYVVATMKTTAANAIFLQDTAPLWVLLLSPLVLKEPLRFSDIGVMSICAFGMYMFFLDKIEPGHRDGNLIAILSGVGFAAVILAMRWSEKSSVRSADQDSASKPTPANLMIVWGNLLCFLACLPLMGPLPEISPAASAGLLKPMAVVAFMGVFQLGLGYYLLNRGANRVPAVEISLLVLAEPLLNPVWAYAVVGEKPGPWALAGGALILGTLTWNGMRKK
jgi:drug/metabolite transporter, DME family